MRAGEQPAVKVRRQRILWTIVGVLLGVPLIVVIGAYLVLVIGLGGWGQSHPTVGDAYTSVEHYYTALQHHDYQAAYSYLGQNATVTVDGHDTVIQSTEQLASLAQQAEQSGGSINGFNLTDGTFEQGKQIVDMTVRVRRADRAYDVHLRVDMTNRAGKILHADNI